MNTILKSVSALLLLLLLSLNIFAQPPCDESLFEAVTDTPIDSAIALIAAAGIGYGFKQLRKRKQ